MMESQFRKKEVVPSATIHTTTKWCSLVRENIDFKMEELSKCAILLWSNRKFRTSPLKYFGDDDFLQLVQDLGDPQTYVFKSSESVIASEFQNVIKGYYSAYNANGEINTENATDLLGNPELDVLKIKETLNQGKSGSNFLSAIVIPNKRHRRDAEEISSTTTTTTASTTVETEKSFKIPEGPVIYKGKSNKGNFYTIMYSSKPLFLKTKENSVYLGSSSLITVDNRLNVVIPLEDRNKLTLRFNFSWLGSYWSLVSVKITDTDKKYNFTLAPESIIQAPAHFSYHCSGETVLSNKTESVSLFLYDLQVQIDSRNEKFSDAADCVHFTTVPIWSGLFVTSIIAIGLIVGLTAIVDIKTMDKFQKIKHQLTITVYE